MAVISVFLEIFRRPTIVEVLGELVLFIAPLWIAVFVGVLVGWAWKPKWAGLVGRKISDCSVSNDQASSSSSSSSSSPLLSLSSSLSPAISLTRFNSIPSLNSLMLQLPNYIPWVSDEGVQSEALSLPAPTSSSDCSSSELERENTSPLNEADLHYISRLVEEKDGGPAWIQMMDRSTPTMSYQAWRRDLESGPPQYRSRTVFDDATPEMVRDFFWDDEFRMKWDDMLLQGTTLEECPTTGAMLVHWVRKFPFFCSDREYLIGRRIWESGRSYYCVTKGVPYPSVPRRNKPRRVDLYYSSWCIRAVESRRGDGQLSACEVILFHYEDMGIPWEIAKLGVKQGMWGAVRKIDPGLRKYQKERALGGPLSRSAQMAQINTKVSSEYLKSVENNASGGDLSENEKQCSVSSEKQEGKGIPKLVVVGGAILLACSLDRGLLTKAVIFGVARRFAKIGGGRRL